MKKNTLCLIILSAFLFLSMPSMANEFNPPIGYQETQRPPKPSFKEIKQVDKMLEKRLNLTDEQIKSLRVNKQKNMKEIQKSVTKMEALHKKISEIYMLGLPKYQADLKSAPYKMELVIHKQNIDKIRAQNRKNFEAMLTPEQKIEFKKFKSELPKRQLER